MEKNSSPETRKRAADLAEVIGANHLDFECVPYSQTLLLATIVRGHDNKLALRSIC